MRSFGCEKIAFVAHLEENPGVDARAFAEAIRRIGITFEAVGSKGAKQVAYSPGTLEDAIAKHARARYGTTTTLVEKARAKLHGPQSFVRIDSPILAKGSTRGEDPKYPAVLEVFWALGDDRTLPTRADLDALIERLERAVPVRVAAAGLVWAGIERPMMKDATAVADEMFAQMLRLPHAHWNHLAKLDTSAQALEPGFFTFLGAEHRKRLGAGSSLRAFSPVPSSRGGVSLAIADSPPLEPTREILDLHIALAKALGDLYPPLAISELACCVSLPKTARFKLSDWLGRYRSPSLLARASVSASR